MNNEQLAKVKSALETGVDLAAAHAEHTHSAYAGYYPDRHRSVDRDVVDMREALAIIERVTSTAAVAAGTIDHHDLNKFWDLVIAYATGSVKEGVALEAHYLAAITAASQKAHEEADSAHHRALVKTEMESRQAGYAEGLAAAQRTAGGDAATPAPVSAEPTAGELLPCPFCGGQPTFSRAEERDDRRYVEMSLECCTSMAATVAWPRWSDIGPRALDAELKANLSEGWNSRTSLPSAGAPVSGAEQAPDWQAIAEGHAQQACRLREIIASAYQIAGAHDAPAHILDVLSDPDAATQEQVDAMLPYVLPADVQELPAPSFKLYAGRYSIGELEHMLAVYGDEVRAALATAMRQQQGDDVGQIEYRGNTVEYIWQKLEARGRNIERAWDALREAGFPPDGTVNLADMIRRAVAAKQAGKDAPCPR